MDIQEIRDTANLDPRTWIDWFIQLLDRAELVKIADYENRKGVPGRSALFKLCTQKGVRYLFVSRHFTIRPISDNFIRGELKKYGLHARQTNPIRPYFNQSGDPGTFTEIEIDRNGLRNWYMLACSAIFPHEPNQAAFEELIDDPRW